MVGRGWPTKAQGLGIEVHSLLTPHYSTWPLDLASDAPAPQPRQGAPTS